MKKKYVKICPKCGSTNIGIQSSGSSVSDFCQACNFNEIKSDFSFSLINQEFPTIEKDKLRNLKKKIRQRKIKNRII